MALVSPKVAFRVGQARRAIGFSKEERRQKRLRSLAPARPNRCAGAGAVERGFTNGSQTEVGPA